LRGNPWPLAYGAPSSPSPEIAKGWRAQGVLLAGIVTMVVVVRLPSFIHQLFDPDEAAIAAQAITLRNGGTLYVDVIDRKPPIPAYIYAWFFDLLDSTDLRPLHGAAAIALAGTAAVVALEGRRRWGTSAGWWAAGLLVGGAVGFLPVDAQAANFAHFALLPGAVAVVAARRGTSRAALVAGIALGLAVLCRQSWAIGVVPGAVAVALAGRRRDVVFFGSGLIATVAAAGIFMPFADFWYWTFASNGEYVTVGASLGSTLASLLASVGLFVLFHLTLVALVGYALHRRVRDLPAWRDDIDLWLWLVSGIVAVSTGLRFFGHYWLQILPPAVLLAGRVAPVLQSRMRRVGAAALAVSTLVVVLFGFAPAAFRKLPDPDPVAVFVKEHTSPDDVVMVWGKFPELYLAADRAPGGSLVHSDFVTGLTGNRSPGPHTLDDAPDDARRELMASLHRNPPSMILDTSTADLRDYGAYPLHSNSELTAFVKARYRHVATVDGVMIYQLEDG
jgi:hypothetical protein